MYKQLLFLLIICVLYLLEDVSGKKCNEVFCASVVSKCMLTQACKCDISLDKEKCTCCLDCAKCLGRYYQQCCNCLEMCDSDILDFDPNDSQVGDFGDPFVELFNAVTSEDAPMVDGIVFRYPADIALDELSKKHHKSKYLKESYNNDAILPRIGVNCTVAFLSQCHSASKCRENCKQIGSGSYRFFFNGCCECVGPTCLNYGISESKCPLCSSLKDDDDYYDQHYMGDDPSNINDAENDFIS